RPKRRSPGSTSGGSRRCCAARIGNDMSAQPDNFYSTRLMTSDDVDAMARIERASYDFPWEPHLFDDCLRARYRCFVATAASAAVVGYGLLSVVLDEAHVLNLCVDPDC